ncbi:hypothetical protein J7E29_02300 [Streptomyces sp. ISL-90]|nr:hypothetical protein [Streptomyces sp. ISL-90]
MVLTRGARGLFTISLVWVLAGCSINPIDWDASGMRVRYDGPDRGKVNACAALTGLGEAREDPRLPTVLEIVQVQVSNTGPAEWNISGVTEFRYGTDEKYDYSWTCRVAIDEAQRLLTAELLSIEQVSS